MSWKTCQNCIHFEWRFIDAKNLKGICLYSQKEKTGSDTCDKFKAAKK